MNDSVKAIIAMISIAIAYVVIGNVMSNVISNAPLNGDSSFTFFVVGLVVGVWVSHRQEWIG